MAKKYSSPAIQVRKVSITSILAGSEQTVSGGTSNKGTGIVTAEGKSTFGDCWTD